MSAIDWAMAAGEWTLRNSIFAAVFFLCVWLIFLVAKTRLSSGMRMTLLILFGIRLFLPFSPESKWSVNNLLSTNTPEEYVVTETPVIYDKSTPADVVVSNSSGSSWEMKSLLSFLWISVAVGFFVTTAVSQFLTGRRINRLRPIEDPELLSLVRECGIPHSVRVVESPDRKTIAVFGSLRVTHLLLPDNLTRQYDRGEIHGMLRHESEHICGNDLLWNWLVFAMQCWHWFNPFVWIAGRYWRNEREIVCDHAALKNLTDTERASYGGALIKSLELSRTPPPRSPAYVPFFRHKTELKLRLQYIMKKRPNQLLPQIGTAIITAVFALATFTTSVSTTAFADEKDGAKSKEDPGRNVEKRDPGAAKKDGDPGGPKPEGDRPPAAPNILRTKEGKVFTTYDKNSDSFVDADEIEAMMEGKQNSRGRREIRKAVDRADADNDDKLDIKEFIWWYTIGRRDERAKNE